MKLHRHLSAVCLFGVAAAAAVEPAWGAGASAWPVVTYPNSADSAASARAAPAEALLARARDRGGRLRVIVGLRAARSVDARALGASQRGLLADLGARRWPEDGAIAGPGVEGVALFSTVPFLAVTVDTPALRRLLANPRVASLQEDVPFAPALSQSVPLVEADQAAAQGYTGTGQVVAVLALPCHPLPG
jgi:hypothetical protein